MLTAHQRIAWARRWPGYTLRIEEAPQWSFSVAEPEGGEAGGLRLRGRWMLFYRDGWPTEDSPVEQASREVKDMLNAA